jgi:hypothetical protein
MSTTFIPRLLLGMAVGLSTLTAIASDDSRMQLGTDVLVSGRSTTVLEAVDGDLLAAGAELRLQAPVAGDALLAGGQVQVDGDIAHSLMAAGGRMALGAQVARNLRAVGGQLELLPQARVAGNASLLGGDIVMRGAVSGYLQAAGGQLRIDGPVEGDVVATARSIELGPSARIGGQLRYASAMPLRQASSAQVAGGIRKMDMPGWQSDESHPPMPHAPGGPASNRWAGWLLAGLVASLVWTLALAATAAVVSALWPAQAVRLAHTVRSRWPMAWLLGFVALVCVPLGAAALLVTGLGTPLGMLALLLYPVLLVLGYLAAGLALGDWALQRWRAPQAGRNRWRLGAAALGVAGLAMLSLVPWVGPLIGLTAMLIGVGAILLQWQKPAAPPSTNPEPA